MLPKTLRSLRSKKYENLWLVYFFNWNHIFKEYTGLEKYQFSLEKLFLGALYPSPQTVGGSILTQSYSIP